MKTTNEVWVYIEQNDGKIADVSLELLGKGSLYSLGYDYTFLRWLGLAALSPSIVSTARTCSR